LNIRPLLTNTFNLVRRACCLTKLDNKGAKMSDEAFLN